MCAENKMPVYGSDDRIKVLFLIPSFQVGGAEKQLIYLLRNLDRKLVTPLLFATSDGPLRKEFEQTGVEIILPPPDARPKLYRFWKLVGEGRKRKVTIVHSFLWGYQLWDFALAKLTNSPLVTSRRDIATWLHRVGWRSWLYRRFATAVTANSHAGASVMTETEKYPAEKIHVIHNGVPLPQKNLPWPKDLPSLQEGELVISYTSAIKAGKNHAFLLDVVDKLPSDTSPWRLVLAGRDCSGGAFEEKLLNSKEKSRVICLGERNDIQNILCHTDIFVMPAVREGFANALSEAMATGVPCIASDSGALPEMICTPKTGILCPPDDVSAFSKALETLLKKPELREKMGKQARAHMASNFSCETATRKFEDVYRKLSV